MRLRKLLFRVHLVLGIVLGLYVSVIGITGSALVYREELAAWSRPELFAPVAAVRVGPDAALATVEQKYPGWRVLTLTGPEETTGVWMAYLLGKGPSKQVYVDAETGALRGEYSRGEGWLGVVERLHFNLLNGRSGRVMNGYCGLACVLLAVSGVWLWRPRFSGWRGVHGNLGLAASLFLIVMGFTGGYFTWYQIYVDGVRKLLPAPKPAALVVPESAGGRRTLGELAAAAKRAVPEAEVFRISLGSGLREPFKISMRHGPTREFQLVSHVSLDPSTGAVLRVEHLRDRAAGNRLIGNFSAVHFGVWGGPGARVLWVAMGLSLPVLFGTSFVLWWRRLRQRGLAGLWI